MNDRNFEYFTTIVQERNISRAAAKLFISQPSLSKFLIQLEKELGVILFERNRNTLILTTAGELYLNYIKKAQALRLDFEQSIHQLDTVPAARLSLGITPGIATLISSTLLDVFQHQCPQAHLELVEDYGQQLNKLFERGRIDMMLSMTGALAQTGTLVHSIPVLPDRILLVAPKSIPQVAALCIANNDFRNPCLLQTPCIRHCNIITGKSDHILYQKTKRISEAYDLQPLSFLETHNTDNCLRLVDAGHGIAFIPQTYIEKGPSLCNSAFFAIDGELFDCTRVIYYRAGNISDHQRIIIDITRNVCSHLFSL